MYLARHFIDNCLHYQLCESWLDGEVYRNRKLLDIGSDPEQYIVYPGGTSFYIDDQIFERLQAAGHTVDYDEVETFFLPFLDPYILNRLDSFFNRGAGRNWKRMDKETRIHILNNTHIFDRRRIHFLRFGQTDLRDLDRSPSLYKILLDKSRDELEQLILEREQELQPNEYKQYIFAIFDLQHHFPQSCARTMPHALDSEQLDDCFIHEICRLDSDKDFWKGMKRESGLVSYLKRYVIMFFDYGFPDGQSWNDFFRAHIGSGQESGPPPGAQRMSAREASTVFGVSQAELGAMSKKSLTRLYRKKAHELHPDKEGGNHERFIELSTAYHEILRTKSDTR